MDFFLLRKSSGTDCLEMSLTAYCSDTELSKTKLRKLLEKYKMPSEASRFIASSISFFMVALDVEDVEHLLLLEKLGGSMTIRSNFLPLSAAFCRYWKHVGADDFVLFGVDAVEFEIAFRPIEISVGQIDGFAGCRAAGGGIDGEAAGVGKTG